jgi:hypothetical protein
MCHVRKLSLGCRVMCRMPFAAMAGDAAKSGAARRMRKCDPTNRGMPKKG